MEITFLSHTFLRVHFYAIYCKYSSVKCTEGVGGEMSVVCFICMYFAMS